eukprot:6172996-Pleurochrysis_carterae.AAC.3
MPTLLLIDAQHRVVLLIAYRSPSPIQGSVLGLPRTYESASTSFVSKASKTKKQRRVLVSSVTIACSSSTICKT